MKVLIVILCSLFSVMSYTYPGNVVDEAVNSVKETCEGTFDLQDIEDVIKVDSGHDYATYAVYFYSGESVSVTQSFDGNRKVSFWVDEVYCN